MIPVENFEQKKQACEEGFRRVAECQKIISDSAKIHFVAGQQNSPVTLISIEGTLEVKKLLQIYEILNAPVKQKVEIKTYNLYKNLNLVFSSDDAEEIWHELGEFPLGSLYEVRDKNGDVVSEFIPF